VLTIDDLDCTPDDGNKYELIEGEIYMSRAPSLTHQIVLRNFLMAMGLYITDNPIGVVVPGAGVIFDDFNGVILTSSSFAMNAARRSRLGPIERSPRSGYRDHFARS